MSGAEWGLRTTAPAVRLAGGTGGRSWSRCMRDVVDGIHDLSHDVRCDALLTDSSPTWTVGRRPYRDYA